MGEYEASQELNADRPEGRANLAGFLLRRGKANEAEQEYLAGLKLRRRRLRSASIWPNCIASRGTKAGRNRFCAKRWRCRPKRLPCATRSA